MVRCVEINAAAHFWGYTDEWPDGASAIVTHNARDFLPAASDFDIEVITPSVMLQRMRK